MAETFDLRGAGSPAELAGALATDGYLADDGLATALYLALQLRRPLLLEGDAGVGKTEVARAVARISGGELIRLQCYEGIDVAQAVYEWDYTRQLLHLRAAETASTIGGATASTIGGANAATPGAWTATSPDALEDDLFSERYLVRRPLLRAVQADGDGPPPVLLIDEVDRADDEFEAFLLEALSDYAVTVPELGTFTAVVPPVVILTSNRTRDVHDALKRRCLYHWVEHPDFAREVQIVTTRAPGVTPELAREVAAMTERFRDLGLFKPPGVAETIDWAMALSTLGNDHVDPGAARATLGTVLKYREDQERVAEVGLPHIVREALERAALF